LTGFGIAEIWQFLNHNGLIFKLACVAPDTTQAHAPGIMMRVFTICYIANHTRWTSSPGWSNVDCACIDSTEIAANYVICDI